MNSAVSHVQKAESAQSGRDKRRRGDMKRDKKEKWPKHKMGKFYGYEENEDGSMNHKEARS